jgi:Ras-related protein Rab-1A
MAEYLIFKIGIFADKEVGKKTLVKNCGNEEDSHRIDLLGNAFIFKNIEAYGKKVRLQTWIYSDNPRHQNYCTAAVNGSLGIILMYDITNANSLNYLSEVFQVLTNFREKGNTPILLVGNKLDLEEQREISKEQIEQFKEEHNIPESMEISLKTGENVEQMLLQITKMIITKGE